MADRERRIASCHRGASGGSIGHDVKTLLATYAHVIRTDEDRVRNVVDDSLGGSAEDWLRTKAV